MSVDREIILRQAEAVAALAVQNNTEIHLDSEINPEIRILKIPDLSEGMPEQLWWNLGMEPSMRTRLEGDAFYSNKIQPLQARIDTLTEEMLETLYSVNPSLLHSILDVFESIADEVKEKEDDSGDSFTVAYRDDMRFSNLVDGSVLAIEAYQIPSGKNLIAGFDRFSSDSDVVAHFKGELPEPAWWKMAKKRQPLGLNTPESEFLGIYNDAKQIGKYATRNPLQFGLGAWVTAKMLQHYWPEICSDSLPDYIPGSYADDKGPGGFGRK
jgi:hypothetical protein